MKYAGLDLHKPRLYVTVVDEDGQIVDEANLKSNSKTINNYLSQYNNPEVVFEATRNWYWLYEALQREGSR